MRLDAYPLGFDVSFDVDVPPHEVTTNHIDHGFGCHETVPDDMRHDGTAFRTRDYETADLLYLEIGEYPAFAGTGLTGITWGNNYK